MTEYQDKRGRPRILLTGATGFVGRALYPALVEKGYDVVCASRHPDRARKRHPERQWVGLEVQNRDSVRAALHGCQGAFYLIHSMSDAEDFESAEITAAMNFVDEAEAAGVKRIVYLGGVRPECCVSPHLRSRLVTGALLRGSSVSTIELRASMIIGRDSASWKMLRDIAVRLPVMVVPRWLRHRTEPLAIDDVVVALTGALELEETGSAHYDIPGPERLTFQECIRRVARLVGNNPIMVPVPFLTPHLSSYWLRFVSGADYHVARQLVEGLSSDLLAEDGRFWDLIGHRDLVPFGEAARRAMEDSPVPANNFEKAVQSLYRGDAHP